MRLALVTFLMVSLTACVQTVSETPGTFVFEGQTLNSVTREFQRSDGSTYERRSIRYGSRFVTCSATDDRDCRGAIQQARIRQAGL